jgi:hypothetical protein
VTHGASAAPGGLPTAAPPAEAPFSAAAEVFRLRAMVPGDVAFVRDSWMRSAWSAEEQKLRARGVKQRDRWRMKRGWQSQVREHVTALIERSGAEFIVACDREDEDHIAGWLAVRDGKVLRVHVKQDYRPWDVEGYLRAAVEAL